MSERTPILIDLMRMSAKIVVGGILIILLVAVGGGILGSGQADEEKTAFKTLLGDDEAETVIQEIKLQGPILTHKPDQSSPFGDLGGAVAYGYAIKAKLKEAAENEDVDGVLLHVSTPGGTIVGSQAIHDGVLAVKEAGKPVVVYVDGLSASGGVWSTAAADAIYADYGSLVGSVGALAGSWTTYVEPRELGGGLLAPSVATEGGFDVRVFKSPSNKDIFNPFRAPTEAEAAAFDKIAADFHMSFKEHVVANRPVTMATLEEVGAMVFGNDDAEELGYIDGTKTYEEVAEEIASRLDAENWRLVKEKGKTGPFGLNASFGQSPDAGLTAALQRREICSQLTSQPSAVLASALGNCAR